MASRYRPASWKNFVEGDWTHCLSQHPNSMWNTSWLDNSREERCGRIGNLTGDNIRWVQEISASPSRSWEEESSGMRMSWIFLRKVRDETPCGLETHLLWAKFAKILGDRTALCAYKLEQDLRWCICSSIEVLKRRYCPCRPQEKNICGAEPSSSSTEQEKFRLNPQARRRCGVGILEGVFYTIGLLWRSKLGETEG